MVDSTFFIPFIESEAKKCPFHYNFMIYIVLISIVNCLPHIPLLIHKAPPLKRKHFRKFPNLMTVYLKNPVFYIQFVLGLDYVWLSNNILAWSLSCCNNNTFCPIVCCPVSGGIGGFEVCLNACLPTEEIDGHARVARLLRYTQNIHG